MPRRPNYRQERFERDRNKEAKQQQKLQRKNEQTAQRKALQADPDTAAVTASPMDAKDEE